MCARHSNRSTQQKHKAPYKVNAFLPDGNHLMFFRKETFEVLFLKTFFRLSNNPCTNTKTSWATSGPKMRWEHGIVKCFKAGCL